ncbi:DNA ligase 3 isoform X2 [Drosophila innubila]|uniref:DNA ligase 3 isoform X2 n=1 Tax=Drosophila innubila TaxID=198719 RepID=UPI00148DE597|nr:DNA ligase 3 isoform X2 [Drosophila innubila]
MLKLVNNIRVWHINRLCGRKMSSKQLKNDDNKLDTFRSICDEIAAESSYLKKVEKLEHFFRKGSSGKGFEGDTLQWVQFLIPGATQRVYNLQNKALIKLFARILQQNQQEMHLNLEQDGDISETLRKHFAASSKLKPQTESKLYLHEVEQFLGELEKRTKEDEQTEVLRDLCRQATDLDLRTFIRLIKQDLRINARARHILDAFGPQAYPAYQSSRDLTAIVNAFAGKATSSPAVKTAGKKTKLASSGIQVMTPVSPMLANACKSVEDAFKKNPGGLYSEIKYDGERVQIHKQGAEFKFFSRNLKPVMDHKIKQLKEFIPRAFPGADDMILDSEIILVDTETGALLPFGTLGAHKKHTFANASVCLFVFDCLLYDGEDLTQLSFCKRREILEQNIQPIKSHVQLSESQFLKTKQELAMMTAKVLQANLEGVVLKSPTGTYQPGKRNWLKVKKDYLFGGKMADTADLIVLGAWYGSGKKGGVLSIFLMGCYDARDHLWKTVTKVHSGLDDATNDEIHESLMKLTERADSNKIPSWLLCKKALIPDVLAKSPEQMPVWEITGAEFTQSEAHTAGGISIRFPRITRLRSDKTAMEANDLEHLEQLYAASKKNVNVDLLLANCDQTENDNELKTQLEKTPQKGKAANVAQTSSRKKQRLSKNESDNEMDESTSCSARKKTKLDTSQGKLKDFFAPKMTTMNIKVENSAETRKSPEIKKENIKSEKSQLFSGLVAHFSADAAESKQMNEFVQHGGTLTTNPQKANLAFHCLEQDMDLQQLRPLYRRSCRHLNVKWMQASLESKILQPYPLYALHLKSYIYFFQFFLR